MNKTKYKDLFELLPIIKTSTYNKKKLTNKEKKCLEIISDYYKENSIAINKIELRNYFMHKRDLLNNDFIKKKSLALNKKIINSKEYKNSKTIFCYISFDKEIDTYYLLNHSLKLKKKVCIPYITGKNSMIAAKITSFENLKKNKFGILEPVNVFEVKKENIDLTIVPALSYNPLGFRLGYGAGFYDNYLKDFKGMTFGMVLKDFLTYTIIPEKHDIPVNKLFIE